MRTTSNTLVRPADAGRLDRRAGRFWTAIAAALLAALAVKPVAAAEPVRVCATTPDLGELAREVGGDRVQVTVFAKGPQDPHFLEPRPSFIKALSGADLLVITGLDLELGWAPLLWRNARNPRVLPGGDGFVDASTVITPLAVPAGEVDRSVGDVHARGNPHYLLDPLAGLRVAALLRDRLGDTRPAERAWFAERHAAFTRRVHEALVGEALARKYDAAKLARLHEHGKLLDFLTSQGDREALGGWLGAVAELFGSPMVAEHDLWPYFARRFGLRVVDYLEPKPGIPPTTRNLADVIRGMERDGVRTILSVPYFHPRHARSVAEKTGARVAHMAHQCGAVAGTAGYLAAVSHNVREVVRCLAEPERSE